MQNYYYSKKKTKQLITRLLTYLPMFALHTAEVCIPHPICGHCSKEMLSASEQYIMKWRMNLANKWGHGIDPSGVPYLRQ